MSKAAALPATLADVSNARLPAVYEAAKTAITECERIDECKNWSDKAAALASYARQANDDSLRVMAVRIQARAERRAGALLKQIPRGSQANLVQRRQEGTRPSVTRTQAADEAGLSEHQRKTALRLASIPEPEFTRQVENPNPPTITKLAERGRQKRVRPERDERPDTEVATRALRSFAKYCGNTDPVRVASAMSSRTLKNIQRQIFAIGRWLNLFVDNLPESTRRPD
jgi:hypothetical protein